MAKYKRGTFFGPFVLDAELADHGGMASVYLARVVDRRYPHRYHAPVALKIARVTDENAAVYEQLLIKETDLLYDLRHPGIVRIHPITVFNKRQYFARAINLASNPDNPTDAPWYFAMEYLAGGSVNSILDNPKLPLEWRIELIYQITVILDYLHLRGVTHRDLKPDNILFRVHPHAEQLPVPVLIDFGLAEKRLLGARTNAATISHAAPEWIAQLLGSPNKFPEGNSTGNYIPADVWALGVTAYEILTGTHPFGLTMQKSSGFPLGILSRSTPDMSELSNDVIVSRIVREAPAPFDDSIPSEVQHLVLDMLNKNPVQRPSIENIIGRLETEIEIVPPRFRIVER